jgi:hypothetical protein
VAIILIFIPHITNALLPKTLVSDTQVLGKIKLRVCVYQSFPIIGVVFVARRVSRGGVVLVQGTELFSTTVRSAPFFHPGDRGSSAGCAPLNSLARSSRAAPPVFARFPCGGSITEVTRDIDVAPRRSRALSVSTYNCKASRVCCCWHVPSGQNLKINKQKIDV